MTKLVLLYGILLTVAKPTKEVKWRIHATLLTGATLFKEMELIQGVVWGSFSQHSEYWHVFFLNILNNKNVMSHCIIYWINKVINVRRSKQYTGCFGWLLWEDFETDITSPFAMHNNISIWVVSESRCILITPSGAILKEEDKKFTNIVLRSKSV